MIKLVPIDAVQASEYNPRRNDEKRLALTELSLRKLGFLLPIYADESGEILSGHQRHLVASRMGFEHIPVEYVSGKTLGERRAVNVLFNRATNDLQKQDTCAIIKRRLYEMDIEAMTGELPDIEPNTSASFPCVHALRRMDVVKLAKLNHRSFDTHIKQLAKSLERRIGSAMPVVIGEAGNVINGIGRLQVAAEAGRKVIACVTVSKAQEAFASSMLNLLIDNAPAMAAACRDRFQDEPRVSVQEGNLWSFLPLKKGASPVLSVLSMQFMPTAYRPSMLRMIYDGLEPGGALIFVEKILSESMDDLMVELYYEMKRENGYTEEQIAAKRRSLENVLSPLKAEWNADLLRTAGFRKVDMFWRCLNFCGWIAVK